MAPLAAALLVPLCLAASCSAFPFAPGLVSYADTGVTVAITLTNRQVNDSWTAWTQQWRKNYKLPQQRQAAFNNFRANLRRIARYQPSPAFLRNWALLSPRLDQAFPQQYFCNVATRSARAAFAAWASGSAAAIADTFEQREPPCDFLPPAPYNESELIRPRFKSPLNASSSEREWDWRAQGKVTPVKDEGKCGASWASAPLAAIESNWLISRKKTYSQSPIDLSEQQLVSCAQRLSDERQPAGCSTGSLTDAYSYASREFLTTESIYPLAGTTLLGRPGTCNKGLLGKVPAQSKLRLASPGWRRLKPLSAAVLREVVVQRPVAAAIYWEWSNPNNATDVLPASLCDYPDSPSLEFVDQNAINVGVLVVGYNLTASPPYWILKMPWGPNFGEKGYIRLEMTGLDGGADWGPCFLYSWMLMPTRFV